MPDEHRDLEYFRHDPHLFFVRAMAMVRRKNWGAFEENKQFPWGITCSNPLLRGLITSSLERIPFNA